MRGLLDVSGPGKETSSASETAFARAFSIARRATWREISRLAPEADSGPSGSVNTALTEIPNDSEDFGSSTPLQGIPDV